MFQISCLFTEEIRKELAGLKEEKELQQEYLNDAKYIAMLLKQMNFVNNNCCEVGAGIEPVLSNMILPEIQASKKKVIVYDPRLEYQDKPGMVIKKENFTMSTNIDNISTLYGLFPCEASITMIEKARRENKNLLLALCDCNLSSKEHPFWGYGDTWAHEICAEYIEKYGREFEIHNWPREYGKKPPIMVRKRKI